MTIYIVCLIHAEEGTEPPYKAFTTNEAAKRYAELELPVELGLNEGGLKEGEEYIIYSTQLES